MKHFRIFLLMLLMSIYAFSQEKQPDTLYVVNNVLKLKGNKNVRFIKTQHETRYIGCHLPKFIILYKESPWLWVIYEDSRYDKEMYYLVFVTTEKKSKKII